MAGTTQVPCLMSANTAVSAIAAFKPGSIPVMLIMPSGWNPAVLLTIQISTDGTNFYDATHSDGTPITATVQPGAGMMVSTLVNWAPYARVRSGTFQSPAPQLADRNFIFVTQP